MSGTAIAPDLSGIRNFLLDLDGTLYLGEHLIDGALEFIRTLRRTGRRYLFLTNNSSYSTSEYCRKLARIGIDAEPDDIFSSTRATIGYLKGQGIKRFYALATPAAEEEFRMAGFKVGEKDAEAVVLGFDKTLTYEKLHIASNMLMKGLPFIATHPDMVCPTDTFPMPDCGAMTELLYSSTGRRPVVIGKPSAYMSDAALAALGAKPENTAMVGDRLYTDMKMAKDSHLTGILVLSGETTAEEAEANDNPGILVCRSVKQLAQWL